MDRAIRRPKKNKRVKVARTVSELEEIFDGELPAEDTSYKIVSEGNIFPASFILYIADRVKINHLYITTFNYGKREVIFLHALHNAGKLGSVTMIPAKMYAMSSKAGGLERLRRFTASIFTQNEWSISYSDNHSKLILMDTDAGKFVVETSCNFSESTCNEYFSVEESPELFSFYWQWIQQRAEQGYKPSSGIAEEATDNGTDTA